MRFALLTCVFLLPAVAGAEDPLATVVVGTDRAPPGWQLQDERRAEDVSSIPEAIAAVRQQWHYRGEPFEIIYFLCANLDGAAALYARHTRALGREAVIVPRGTIVAELHGAPREVWGVAAALLDIDAAQRRKMVAAALPAGWTVADEFLAPAAEVAHAGAALDAPVQSVLVQEVESPNGRLRINYLLCADRTSAAQVYERSWSVQRANAFVTLDGPVVIEILAANREALLPALEVLEAAPLLVRPAAS